MNNSNNDNFEELGKVLDHEYDNIRELDNPLPGWWLATFWLTIIFSVGYYTYYELMSGPTLDEELSKNLAVIQQQAQSQSSANGDTEDSLKALVSQPEISAIGQAQYQSKCLACHGANGEGVIGPNLTDDFWIHGDGSLLAIQEAVNKGFLEKGMPAWENLLSKDETRAVVAFIRSIHGTNPANAKEPQGEKKELKP